MFDCIYYNVMLIFRCKETYKKKEILNFRLLSTCLNWVCTQQTMLSVFFLILCHKNDKEG